MRTPARPTSARVIALAAAAVAFLCASAEAEEQDRVRWLGEMRNIAVHAPPVAAGELPLLLVLGDPGRAARYALKSWREVADREGFVVAAVGSRDPRQWRVPQDGPGFLRAVVRHVKGGHSIDPRRMYLFGYGVGGGFALGLGALEPRYFAAVASFGGDPQLQTLNLAEPLDRALPVRVYYSKRTLQFDVDALLAAAADLRELGAEVEVEKLDLGTDFERKGGKVAGRIWKALSAQELSEPARYRSTRYDR